MHCRSAYDVTQLRYLRRVGKVQPAPHGACAAAVQRCGKVKLLERVFMMQMCDALQLVGPSEDASSSAIDEALRELDAELSSRLRRRRSPSSLSWMRRQSSLRLSQRPVLRC